MLEEDHSFLCPYCGSEMSIRLDISGGKRQSFVYDCENCCSPIQIQAEFEGDSLIQFTADTLE